MTQLTQTEQLAMQAEQIAMLELRLRTAERRLATSLANNLCPDHRDKQGGKPCLACTIEQLERKLHGQNESADCRTVL